MNNAASIRSEFASTQWSLVVAAGADDSAAREALESLCQSYWYPIYAYVRRRTNNAEDAKDQTQEFFTHLLEKKTIERADPSRGRFRTFLLTAAKNFLINQWEKAMAKKRSAGGSPALSIDFASAESRFQLEARCDDSPERLFERRWALSLLDQTLSRLQNEYTSTGKAEQFEHLKVFLTGQHGGISQAEVGDRLNISEEAVRSAVYRLRKRYRILLRDEIARTVATPDEIEDELRGLFQALES